MIELLIRGLPYIQLAFSAKIQTLYQPIDFITHTETYYNYDIYSQKNGGK